MKRILFVHNQRTSFVQADLRLLAERYLVTERHVPTPRRLHLWQTLQEVKRHDLVFCWFASWHALAPVLLAKALAKPSLVVVGGYDTAKVPEAGYGSQRGGVRKYLSRAVMRSATHLLANSRSARDEAVHSAGANLERVTAIYHGVEPLPPGPVGIREPVALTVGNVWRENLLRKGLLPFVQAAARLPEVRFVHVGRWCDDSIADLRAKASSNVEFRGYLSDVELADVYGRASVYVQASLHEGFGLSVAEAMTAGCIPVVTRRGSLPEVVGEVGIYTESTNPEDLAAAIRLGLAAGCDARQAARARILDLFPMRRRRQALFDLIDTLIDQSSVVDPPVPVMHAS